MTARLILTYPNQSLHKSSSLVSQDDNDDLQYWIKDLKDTLRVSDGIGLAAIQVGIPKKIFVVDKKYLKDPGLFGICEDKNGIYTFINPILSSQNSETYRSLESCLSVPGVSYPVLRLKTVQLFWEDENRNKRTANISGFDASVIQHENDHLLGTLFIRKINSFDRRNFLKLFDVPKKKMTDGELKNMREKNRSTARKERKKKTKK